MYNKIEKANRDLYVLLILSFLFGTIARRAHSNPVSNLFRYVPMRLGKTRLCMLLNWYSNDSQSRAGGLVFQAGGQTCLGCDFVRRTANCGLTPTGSVRSSAGAADDFVRRSDQLRFSDFDFSPTPSSRPPN